MMKSNQTPNILPAEEAIKFSLWTAPEVTGHTVNKKRKEPRVRLSGSTDVRTPVTAQSAEKIREAAYAEGLSKGRIKGQAEIRKEQQHIVESLDKLLQNCHKQAGNFDQQICDQLVTLTAAIAKQVIRRELSTDPEQIMAVIREAINHLPTSSAKLVLTLHPDDANLVREIYHLNEQPDRTWTIFEDPNMQRGGCIISTESSVVNADLDHRIATIVNQLLGGDRNDD